MWVCSYVCLSRSGSYREAFRDTVGGNCTADAALDETCWAIDGAAQGAFERTKSTGQSTADFRCLTGDLWVGSVLLDDSGEAW